MSKEKKRKKNNSKKIYLEANRSQFSDQKDIFFNYTYNVCYDLVMQY